MAISQVSAKRRNSRLTGLLLFVLPLVSWAQPVDSAADCGDPFANGVGPYDYNNPGDRAQKIWVVEQNHFNADVQSLRAGQSSAYIMGDLDYTLRAVPNHHLALATLVRYSPRRVPEEARFMDTECYFVRAVTFTPDDPVVRVAYGAFLTMEDRPDDAEEQYLQAVEIDDDYAEAHYNLGLLYVDRGEIEKAREHAKRAYALGFPLPGLQRKLDRHSRAATP